MYLGNFETKPGEGDNVSQCAYLDQLCINQLIKVVNVLYFFIYLAPKFKFDPKKNGVYNYYDVESIDLNSIFYLETFKKLSQLKMTLL